MRNKFGILLDTNGYAPSLFPTGCCYLCKCQPPQLVRHEVYHGSLRKKSKAYGLWAELCPG